MDPHPNSTSPEIAIDASPMLRIYKDGRIERLMGTDTTPPGFNPKFNVYSKDILDSSPNFRLYIPKNITAREKLPVLIFFHGGAFCIGTAASPVYHNYLNTLVAEAKIIAVSVDYRRAPEHPIPAAYDDSWASIKWVAAHFNWNWPRRMAQQPRGFRESILRWRLRRREYRAPHGHEIRKREIGGYNRQRNYSNASVLLGADDPWINPLKGPNLAGIGCIKVLVLVAEKDLMRHRGWRYYEEVKKSEWGGEIEIMEAEGEDHVFFLFNPSSENAVALIKNTASFLNRDRD